MNILNKGRCLRCIASKKETKIKIENTGLKTIIQSLWLKCTIKNNWCKHCAISCKESPMGISATSYENKIKEAKP